MGLRESLAELKARENLNVKREVKKALTQLKNAKIREKKCILCSAPASYAIKGSHDWYCKQCAIDCFGDVKYLQKK